MKKFLHKLISFVLIVALGLEFGNFPYKHEFSIHPSHLAAPSEFIQLTHEEPGPESSLEPSPYRESFAELGQMAYILFLIYAATTYSVYFEKNKFYLISAFLVYEFSLNILSWRDKFKSEDYQDYRSFFLNYKWEFLILLFISLPFAPVIAAFISTALFENYLFLIFPIVISILLLNRIKRALFFNFASLFRIFVTFGHFYRYRNQRGSNSYKKTLKEKVNQIRKKRFVFNALSLFLLTIITNSIIVLTLYSLGHDKLKVAAALLKQTVNYQYAVDVQNDWRDFIGIKDNIAGEPEYDIKIRSTRYYGYKNDSILSKLTYPIQKEKLKSVLNKHIPYEVHSKDKNEPYFKLYYQDELLSAYFQADNKVLLSSDEMKSLLRSEDEDHFVFAFILLAKSSHPELRPDLIKMKNKKIIMHSPFVRLWYLKALTYHFENLNEDLKDQILSVIAELRMAAKRENSDPSNRSSFVFQIRSNLRPKSVGKLIVLLKEDKIIMEQLILSLGSDSETEEARKVLEELTPKIKPGSYMPLPAVMRALSQQGSYSYLAARAKNRNQNRPAANMMKQMDFVTYLLVFLRLFIGFSLIRSVVTKSRESQSPAASQINPSASQPGMQINLAPQISGCAL